MREREREREKERERWSGRERPRWRLCNFEFSLKNYFEDNWTWRTSKAHNNQSDYVPARTVGQLSTGGSRLKESDRRKEKGRGEKGMEEKKR